MGIATSQNESTAIWAYLKRLNIELKMQIIT